MTAILSLILVGGAIANAVIASAWRDLSDILKNKNAKKVFTTSIPLAVS